jgi:DNA-binding transcriptional ArsR family regulator
MPPGLNPQLLPKVVQRLKALADENRIRLLLRLRRGECRVGALADELALAQASASKHLAVLKECGLVRCRRDGTQCVYSIRDDSVFDLCSIVCDGVVRHLKAEHACLGLANSQRRLKGANR